MKNIRLLVICLFLMQLLGQPAYGGWKERISINQANVTEYIKELRAGQDPDNLNRPHLRRSKEYKAKLSTKELKKLMDEAERLARDGKYKQIPEPVYMISGLPEEKFDVTSKQQK